MTIIELVELLTEEIKKGNGKAEVCCIDILEPCLCSVTKESCGFYTEESFIIDEKGEENKIGESTGYLVGNLDRITDKSLWE